MTETIKLRTFDISGTRLRRSCKVFTITCDTDEIANRVADQFLAIPPAAAQSNGDDLAKLADELTADYPAVDVTAVGFSKDFAGVGCCVIPQDRVLAIIAALRAASEGTRS